MAATSGGSQAVGTMPMPASNPDVVQRKIPGRAGAPDVTLHIINGEASDTPRPAILHMHGGGYIMGEPAMSYPTLIPLAKELNCVVVSVDYRLAPGTPFPGSLEDNYAGLLWLYKNAAELGVDRTRIAVMGESAGGGHAAMLTIAARDRGEVPLKFQALIYPMLDDRTGATREVSPLIGTILWTAEQNRKGWSALLGAPAGSARVPDGAVPARVANLAGLPPAYISTGALDLFVDEDIDYAQRLLNLGVPVELNVVPGAFHGFDFLAPETQIARRFQASTTEALRRGLAAN
jgi:acetyl esterase/lipase